MKNHCIQMVRRLYKMAKKNIIIFMQEYLHMRWLMDVSAMNNEANA